MFPFHNPAQQVFNWHCRSNNIPKSQLINAAVDMRGEVSRIRKLYNQPIGRTLPYDDSEFRSAYLLAYFPYYIEPVCHVMAQADLPSSLFETGRLKAAFFGGGPCPEVLGLAAYLRKRAPKLAAVEATVFDLQAGWQTAQYGLVKYMMPYYKSGNTQFELKSKSCDVVSCLSRKCICGAGDIDIIIAQNFLTEIYTGKQSAMETFERLINRSQCKYIIFVDNMYNKVKEMMNELSAYLYSKGLTTGRPESATSIIRPNFELPQVMQEHLFTGEDWLIERRNVKYHYMVLEIAR